MTLSSVFTLFLLLIGCTLADDPAPINKDAPELNFSNPLWVNEFKYDGAFTLNKFDNGRYRAMYAFYGAEAKKFEPVNSSYQIENGYWFEPSIAQYLILPSYAVNMSGDVSINNVPFERMAGTSMSFTNKSNPKLAEDIETNGISWQVKSVFILEHEDLRVTHNLTPNDEKSFIHEKKSMTVFPELISLEKAYTLGKEEQEITINFKPIKNADVIYFQFEDENYFTGSHSYLKSRGFMKYLAGSDTQIKIKKSELLAYCNNIRNVKVTAKAIKFYSEKVENRNFIYKNIANSTSIIAIEN